MGGREGEWSEMGEGEGVCLGALLVCCPERGVWLAGALACSLLRRSLSSLGCVGVGGGWTEEGEQEEKEGEWEGEGGWVEHVEYDGLEGSVANRE